MVSTSSLASARSGSTNGGWPPGTLRIEPAEHLADAVTRSHLGDGRAVGWYGDPDWVLDAEIERPVPPALASRFGADDFWGRWTRAECAAKLTGVPIARWTRRHGLSAGPLADEPSYRSHTVRHHGLVISAATLRPTPTT